MTQRPKRYRYILRVEVGAGMANAIERLLVPVAQRIPYARLARSEYDDHGDHLMHTGRTQLVPTKGKLAPGVQVREVDRLTTGLILQEAPERDGRWYVKLDDRAGIFALPEDRLVVVNR